MVPSHVFRRRFHLPRSHAPRTANHVHREAPSSPWSLLAITCPLGTVSCGIACRATVRELQQQRNILIQYRLEHDLDDVGFTRDVVTFFVVGDLANLLNLMDNYFEYRYNHPEDECYSTASCRRSRLGDSSCGSEQKHVHPFLHREPTFRNAPPLGWHRSRWWVWHRQDHGRWK